MLGFLITILLIGTINSAAGFAWNNCGENSDPIGITSLNVFQNESLVLLVKGQGKLARDIQAPIKMALLVEKKLFWGWTPVPCINNFGTCTYNDICALSPYTDSCPDILVNQGLPCKCPVTQGPYSGSGVINLKSSDLPSWLEKGSYRVKAAINDQTGRLLCLAVTLQLK